MSIPPRNWSLVLSLLVAGALSAFGEKERPTPKKDPLPRVSDEVAVKVIENALRALGGREARDSVQNLVLRGHETYQKDTYETFIFKTRDDQLRIERRRNFNGRPIEFYWIVVPGEAFSVEFFRGKPTHRWFTEAEAQALLFDNQMFPCFANHAMESVRFRYLEKLEDAHAIRCFLPTGQRVDYTIDAQTFLPRSYSYRVRNGARTETRRVVISRYLATDNTLWPAELTFMADDLVLSEFKANRIASNQDLPGDLFTPPERPILSNEEEEKVAEIASDR